MNHVGDWTAYWARRTPEAIALYEPLTSRRWSYWHLDRRANRLARALSDGLGVGKGDRVAVLAHNRGEHLRSAVRLRQARRASSRRSTGGSPPPSSTASSPTPSRRCCSTIAPAPSSPAASSRPSRIASPTTSRPPAAAPTSSSSPPAPTRPRRTIGGRLRGSGDPHVQLGHHRPPQRRADVASPARLQLALDAARDRADHARLDARLHADVPHRRAQLPGDAAPTQRRPRRHHAELRRRARAAHRVRGEDHAAHGRADDLPDVARRPSPSRASICRRRAWRCAAARPARCRSSTPIASAACSSVRATA